MGKLFFAVAFAAASFGALAVSEQTTLWKNGDGGVKSYRIPALCTAPNGDLVAVCDARKNHAGDLNTSQPINISCRRSTDGGETWSDPVNTWTWKWDEEEHWAGSDPSLIVDADTKKIFLFYNVWESKKRYGIFMFYVQESSDNGKTWSKPRDISQDIAFAGWPFGKTQGEGGFIFITSGSGIQTKDGTLLHTIVHVGDGNALFGSTDHGKTWKAIGTPAKCGDECKVVELLDGSWMINSRWRGGGRQIHVSKDRGATWESRYDSTLVDPQCNAQIMRYPLASAKPGKALKPGLPESVLVFSNCNASGRRNLFVRTSWDEGATWSEGVCVESAGAAYSDVTVLPSGKLGVLFEGAGYATIRFCTLEPHEFLAR